MSYDSKIKSVQEIVEQHNQNAENKIEFDKFLSKLNELGGTSDEALQAVSWEDLEECGLPRIMARRVTHVFRQSSNGDAGASGYVSTKKAAMLSIKELVERYHPKDAKNAVGKRLKELADDKPFIVFDDDNKVMVEESIRLLEDIVNGLPAGETAFVNGRPLPVYSIGERPDFYADENPIYCGRALRSNETCDQTGRSWQGVSVEIRQLLWLASCETGELDINTVSGAHDVLDKVLSKDCSLDSLRGRYPEASKSLDEKRKMGSLPLLKVKVGDVLKGNNPFGRNSRY